MNNEYECKAWIDGKLVDVIASYEVDYTRPLVYGIFTADWKDVTRKIHPDEYDRIYSEICEKVLSDMTDAAEMAADMER